MVHVAIYRVHSICFRRHRVLSLLYQIADYLRHLDCLDSSALVLVEMGRMVPTRTMRDTMISCGGCSPFCHHFSWRVLHISISLLALIIVEIVDMADFVKKASNSGPLYQNIDIA